MQLNAKAREFLRQYHNGLRESYGATDGDRWFALSDPKETQMRNALLEESSFLNLLTVADVDQLQGQVVPVGSSGLYTGRVLDGRFRKKVGVSGNDYRLVETDSCAALTWQLLSVWANAGDENEFFQRVQEFTNQAFALDMLRIGFNGTKVAETTNAETNPNGEDVNKGWHQIVKEWKDGQQIITDKVVLDGDGTASALLPVKATGTGGAYNLAPGYYRILPVAVDGISHVASEENWLTVPGADEESDDELRERCRNQFNLVGNYHTDAVYRSMIAGVAGLSIDRIFFEHEAPRGPGTANAYLLLDSGVASAPFVDAVNDYINTQGHHGHGDDMQCYAMPETLHDLAVTVWVRNLNNISDDEQKRLKDGIENLIRCAFRENTDYDVRRTWPYSRFSFSQLGREIHKNFPVTESLNFSLDDIASELNVPRLKSLVVSIENE